MPLSPPIVRLYAVSSYVPPVVPPEPLPEVAPFKYTVRPVVPEVSPSHDAQTCCHVFNCMVGLVILRQSAPFVLKAMYAELASTYCKYIFQPDVPSTAVLSKILALGFVKLCGYIQAHAVLAPVLFIEAAGETVSSLLLAAVKSSAPNRYPVTSDNTALGVASLDVPESSGIVAA